MVNFLWPILIAILILGIACFLYFFLEDFFEFEISFLWIAAIFFVIYVAAAGFFMWKLPNPLKNSAVRANAQTTDTREIEATEVQDVIVR